MWREGSFEHVYYQFSWNWKYYSVQTIFSGPKNEYSELPEIKSDKKKLIIVILNSYKFCLCRKNSLKTSPGHLPASGEEFRSQIKKNQVESWFKVSALFRIECKFRFEERRSMRLCLKIKPNPAYWLLKWFVSSTSVRIK